MDQMAQPSVSKHWRK